MDQPRLADCVVLLTCMYYTVPRNRASELPTQVSTLIHNNLTSGLPVQDLLPSLYFIFGQQGSLSKYFSSSPRLGVFVFFSLPFTLPVPFPPLACFLLISFSSSGPCLLLPTTTYCMGSCQFGLVCFVPVCSVCPCFLLLFHFIL